MGTVVQSEADIDAFMAHTKPPVHLLLDTGHARWGGADPAGLARAYRERIGHVHCKDVRDAVMREVERRRLELPRFDPGVGEDLGVFTVPGDGMIDYAAVFRELQGLFRLGGAGGRAGPEEGARSALCQEGFAHIRAALKEAGLACDAQACAGARRVARLDVAAAMAQSTSLVQASMPQPLARHPPRRRGGGQHITPASAGWCYVGFDRGVAEAGRQVASSTPAARKSASWCSRARPG